LSHFSMVGFMSCFSFSSAPLKLPAVSMFSTTSILL
jgi:hypothetical protein